MNAVAIIIIATLAVAQGVGVRGGDDQTCSAEDVVNCSGGARHNITSGE